MNEIGWRSLSILFILLSAGVTADHVFFCMSDPGEDVFDVAKHPFAFAAQYLSAKHLVSVGSVMWLLVPLSVITVITNRDPPQILRKQDFVIEEAAKTQCLFELHLVSWAQWPSS